MNIIFIAGSIVIPLMMYYVKTKIKKSNSIFNILGIISAIIFGSIASNSIYNVIRDNTLFMTTIHGVFLNPLFLITGSYLGVYIVYRLLIVTLLEH